MKFRSLLVLLAAVSFAAPLHLSDGADTQQALDRISANSMRANLSFLASDALEGRATPSRGLEVAAEFIAAEFRKAGLAGPVDGGYFQSADFYQLTRKNDGLSGTIKSEGEELKLDSSSAAVVRGLAAADLDHVAIFKQSGDTVPDEIAGKAVVIEGRGAFSRLRSLQEKKPAIILTLGRGGRGGGQMPRTQLVASDQLSAPGAPTVALRGESASKFFADLPDGLTKATLTIHVPAAEKNAVKLRNVIGLLPGSDPTLKGTYIIVTAHYDHLGMMPPGEGDRIYNGANDDGSGVVSVIELAGALASLHPRPKRSIVFMTVFGEEEGLYGSQYYGRHPVFPLGKTVADVNIEQVGRTDDNEGPQVASATFTGFTYSDLPELFSDAGKETGVRVYDRNSGKDPYFARSDNQALADDGIPSHTVAVALEFPDYHKPGDEWEKIDYANMALIDRMLGLGIISLANDPETPKWNKENPNTKKYIQAWQALHPAQ